MTPSMVVSLDASWSTQQPQTQLLVEDPSVAQQEQLEQESDQQQNPHQSPPSSVDYYITEKPRIIMTDQRGDERAQNKQSPLQSQQQSHDQTHQQGTGEQQQQAYQQSAAQSGNNQGIRIKEEPRTNLIINYLPQNMNEKELYSLFVTIGPVESCRVMKDYKTGYSYGFGFVNYAKAEDAAKAITALNGLQVQNKRLKVSFARPSGDEIKETNLYVTNLPRNITESQIDELFSKYGNIVQKNILKDKLTGLPRGVAFVRFDKREEAQEAINQLHGTVPEGGSEPLSVKIAEEHGKQKAAYYAGWQAGYNQSRGPSGGNGSGTGLGGARARGIGGPPGVGMGLGGGPGMLGRAGGFGPRGGGGPHGTNFLGSSGSGPGAMRMEKIHPHRYNPIGMGGSGSGNFVPSHFW
ncbi:sex-lethal homolog isoform X1 [Pseudomyrmex gracilis]|uniref:sex-lethal homolog isoform X1 n=2 Tax=Pseudomyrmex gracilis TaxID=219809 RepID=UPI000995861B|nr:sex-lethal homolog isoform X1 [Pseudomyrmex gracilis]XP_020296741.1 sex-lethal homolog isoform X1 [Pseudomyrmex gracilis]XP_020296742.1 sex-lethal homolog isoform X1 [Pseudomyrmex gracilis]XP_020296743.1 sex-lethal homolog isoform X1 [Pseudomyrmex gracilis]